MIMGRKLTIAISGPPGAGSSSVAKSLARKLNLRYFSPGEFFKSYSKSKKALKVWKKEGRKKKFHQRIDEDQIKRAKEGNIVICGKLSIFFLKDIADLKVWVDCPFKIRVKRIAKREKIPVFKAFEEVKEREKIEREEWKRIYGFDYFNSRNLADLMVDSSKKTPEEITNEIINFIKGRK